MTRYSWLFRPLLQSDEGDFCLSISRFGATHVATARLSAVVPSALLALTVFACAPAAIPAASSPPATASTPAAPARSSKELILAAPRDLAPGENDRYYTAQTPQTWENLATVDDNWSPQPQLAESGSQAADSFSWMFRLRRDVVFSSGSPFNADVVAANFNRNIRISPRTSPFYALAKLAAYGDLKTVEQVDDYAVRFVHNTAAPDISPRDGT